MTRPLVTVVLLLGAGVSTVAQVSSPAVFTAAQAEAGRTQLRSNAFGACTDCHGNTLVGRDQKGAPDDPPMQFLPDNIQRTIRMGVPQLVGQRFVERWRDQSTRDLSEGFKFRFGSVVTPDIMMNIMAYVLQLNGAAAGQSPLTMDTDVRIGLLLPPYK